MNLESKSFDNLKLHCYTFLSAVKKKSLVSITNPDCDVLSLTLSNVQMSFAIF